MKTIILNGNKYDFDFIVKKYGTDNIEELAILTKKTEDERIRAADERGKKFDEELDKAYNLASAVGDVPLNTDLLEYVGK